MLSTNKPKLDLIEENLNKGIPVIVGVNNAELRQNPNAKYNHYIVVSGIRNNKFIITDPSPNFPEPYEVDKNILEKAWYAMGAYVLVVGVSKS